MNFISNSGAIEIDKIITNTFQKDIKNTLNGCKYIIDNNHKGRLINLNPSTPILRGLIKIHKENTPVRPIVNLKNALSYKLAKMFVKRIQTYIPLPDIFNGKNSVQLIEELSEIPSDPNLKKASFDITNMYTNIPTKELIDIMDRMCDIYNVDRTLKQEILKRSKLLITQNCFQFQEKNSCKLMV